MESKTVRHVLIDTLERLSRIELRTFYIQMVKHVPQPWTNVRAFSSQDPTEIADLMVSAFTELGAPTVAVETLTRMGYKDEADRLTSNIEAGGRSTIPQCADIEESGLFMPHYVDIEAGGRSTIPQCADIEESGLFMPHYVDIEGSGLSIMPHLGDIEAGGLSFMSDFTDIEAGGLSFMSDFTEEHFVDRHKDYLIHDVGNVEHILDELLKKGVIQQEGYDEISALSTSEEKIKELIDGHLKTVGSKDIFQNIAMENLKTQGPVSSSSMPSGSDDQYFKVVRMFENTEIDIDSTPGFWIQLEPEVNCVDSEDAPIYSLRSEAGRFQCSVSGLRWVCKEMVSFKYQFGSWEEHMKRMETMHYIPGGPLLDITVVAGELDEAHLPHWICTKDSPAILTMFAVLHIDSCGDVVEQVSEVTPSHVKLFQPIFSPRGVLMRAGFSVKIKCKVLIYKTNKALLTLHVYLIPRDPALQQAIKNKELSSGCKMIEKSYPVKPLKMRNHFILTADVDTAKILPKDFELEYEGSDPNFFEVFIESPDNQHCPATFQLTMSHESGPVWTCDIRKDDYENTGDIRVMYEEELARVRRTLVERVSRELVNQLLDDLFEDGVLNEGEKDSILQENNTRTDRARCLIDMVKRKGREASRKIFTHLRSRDPTLYAELGLPSG